MTCTQDNWNVGTMSGGDIDGVLLQPFKGFFRGKARRAECYGKRFDSSDEAFAYALEHGYTQEHVGRPGAFIYLRLSPASRHWLRSKHKADFWDCLEALVKEGAGDYWNALRTKSYMASRRAEMEEYVRSPGTAYRDQFTPSSRRKAIHRQKNPNS